jgi:hypothetical protein
MHFYAIVHIIFIINMFYTRVNGLAQFSKKRQISRASWGYCTHAITFMCSFLANILRKNFLSKYPVNYVSLNIIQYTSFQQI